MAKDLNLFFAIWFRKFVFFVSDFGCCPRSSVSGLSSVSAGLLDLGEGASYLAGRAILKNGLERLAVDESEDRYGKNFTFDRG
jgi:hypothetical protein